MKQALLLIAPVLAIALSYFTWQFLIRTKGTGEFIDMKLSSFTGEKFLNVLKGMTTWGHIPFLYFALFFIIAGLFITFILKDISKKQALTGACGFLLAFILFFYGYTSHYGLMLSSIHRYTSTFSFAFLIYLLLRVVSSLKPKVEMAFEKTKEGSSHPKTLMQTIFPDRRLNAGRVLFIGLLLMIGAVLILFNSKNYQLENNSWESAQQLTLQAETSILKSLDAGSLPYDATHPAKCYLALGGDIRKQSQRHETYALAAIGSAVNIQNIWCDKLFNEAEDGVITSQSQMTEIWARNLLEGQYEYVIVAEADEDIVYAISQISAESSLVKVGEECLLKVVPADASYGISFMKQ